MTIDFESKEILAFLIRFDGSWIRPLKHHIIYNDNKRTSRAFDNPAIFMLLIKTSMKVGEDLLKSFPPIDRSEWDVEDI